MDKKCIVCKGSLPDKNGFRIYCSKKCGDIKRAERENNKKIQRKCKRCGKIKEQSYLRYCNKCGIIRRRECKEKEKETKKRYGKELWKKNKNNLEWRKKKYESFKKAYKKKYENDKNFRLAVGLRNRLCTVIKKYTKEGKIMSSNEYGIDYKKIVEHLEPFPKDLKNYEIHHIRKLSTFHFINKDGTTNLKEVRKAFVPKNHKLITKRKHKEIHKANKLTIIK